MDIRDLVANYMTESFKPVKITATQDAWSAMRCCNPYFETSMRRDKSLLFFIKKHHMMKLLDHPATFLASILDEFNNSVNLETIDETHVSLDSRGEIPERWILMLKDFYLPGATIEYNSAVTEEQIKQKWHSIVLSCPEKILINLLNLCCSMMHDIRYTITVTSEPEYKELENCTEEERKWWTGDSYCSQTASLFMEKSENYSCLYGGRYYPLSAAEGGICMRYASTLPWNKIRKYMYNHGNGYHDTRGHKSYYPRKDLPLEEIVILREALLFQGAKVNVTIF